MTTPPALDPMLIAREQFGIDGTATTLPGYVDTNVRISSGDDVYVLRIADRADPEATRLIVEAQIVAFGAGLPVAETLLTRDGSHLGALPDGRIATMRRWLEGDTFEDLDHPASAARSIGETAARMVIALAPIEGTNTSSRRWDLAHADSTISELRNHIKDDTRQHLVEQVVIRLRECSLAELPRQVVHNDLNPGNLIVKNDHVTGIIDFGDCTTTYRIAELAIATAYLMMKQEDPVAVAAEACAAYAALQTVTAVEAGAFLTLVLARLAVSGTVAASRVDPGPTNQHQLISRDDAWETLERLLAADIDLIDAELHTALGHDLDSQAMADRMAADRSKLGASLSLAYDKPITILRGRGQYLYDDRARRYLDCVNNVCHVGHSEPRVVHALASQAATLNTNTRYLHPEVLRYADRLRQTMPKRLDTVFVVNSGSEANELAIRLARVATGRTDIAAIEHGYHGNTSTLIDISHYKFAGKGGSGPKQWVHILPSFDAHETATQYADAATATLSGTSIAAGIVEALPGCAGQLVPPKRVLAGAYDTIRAAGGLVIADEVQTGFGRTGSTFWAFQLFGVIPDIVTMGKPSGNGHPLAAVVTSRQIAEDFNNGMEYFNTFGGNPVSAAVGNAVLDVIEQDGLQAHAAAVGDDLLSRLRAATAGDPRVADVRGIGLYIGVELVNGDRPDRSLAHAIVESAKAWGVLLSTDGPEHNVIKIKPPMRFSMDDSERVASTIADALADSAG
ncbi:MAG: aminotransferase class III-fold pyridoxal phosphate-dependent enzyme [Acidimicrobiia bacterium]